MIYEVMLVCVGKKMLNQFQGCFLKWNEWIWAEHMPVSKENVGLGHVFYIEEDWEVFAF